MVRHATGLIMSLVAMAPNATEPATPPLPDSVSDASLEASIVADLVRAGARSCPVCALPLRELHDGRCPACRSELVPALAVAGLPWAWAIVLAAGVASVSGAAFVLTFVGMHRGFGHLVRWEGFFFWSLLGWGLLVTASAGRGRQRFHRASRGVRALACAVAWGGLLVLWAAILIWVR